MEKSMKKLIAGLLVLTGLFFIVSKINAAQPLDQMGQSRTVYTPQASSTNPPTSAVLPAANSWNAPIAGSSNPASGSATSIVLPVVQTTMTFNGGVSNSTFTAKNCITDLSVSLSSGSTFYLLDGGTTAYVILGAANLPFSGATTSIWTKHWDHTGPWCGTAGNTVTLSIPAPAVATGNNAINVEGYSVIPGLAAIYNQGQ